MKQLSRTLPIIIIAFATGCGSGESSSQSPKTNTSAGNNTSSMSTPCSDEVARNMTLYTEAYRRERGPNPEPLTRDILIRASVRMSRDIEIIPEVEEMDACCLDPRFNSSLFCVETAP